MIVLEKPNYPPYVCINCGIGEGNTRQWYVDLSLNLEHYFNPVNDGAAYLCNLCWEATVLEVQKLSQNFVGTFSEIPLTYENQDELLTEIKLKEEEENGTRDSTEPTVSDPVSTESDSELTGDTELSEPIVETVESDSDDAPTKSLRNFTGFFSTGRTD